MPVDQNDIATLQNAGFSSEEIADYDRRNAEQTAISPPSELPAQILRYGVPLAASLLTANPLVGGAVAGGSEMLARKVSPSTAQESPAMTGGMGAVSGALGVIAPKYMEPVVSRILSKISTPIRLVTKRLLFGKELPTQQRIMFDVLADLGSAPSLGQASPKGLSQRVDDIVRSSIGGREVVQRLDEKNIKLIENEVFDYVSKFGDVAWNGPMLDANGIPREIAKRKFGTLVRGLLNKETDLGQKAVGSLYNQYRMLVEPENLQVPVQGILDVLKKQKGNMFMRRVAPKIKPWLKTTKGMPEDMDTAFSSLVDDEMLGEMDDNAIEAMLNELASVESIPLENATEILRVLNTSLRGKSRGEAAMASMLKNTLQPEAKAAMRQVPGAEEVYDTAQNAYGQLADRLYNKPVQQLLGKLKDYPSTITETVMRSDARYDTLLALKKAFVGGVGGAPAFEESVLTPLRHQLITEAIDRSTGRLSGQRLASTIDNVGTEFSEEVFGKGSREGLRNFASVLTRLQSQGKGSSMWIQLMQGGMILSAVSGLAYDTTQDSTQGRKVAVPATVLFLSPLLLSRFVANPQFLRALVTGMESGPGTIAFARMSSLAGVLTAKEKLSNRYPTGSSNEFYNGVPDQYIQPQQDKQ